MTALRWLAAALLATSGCNRIGFGSGPGDGVIPGDAEGLIAGDNSRLGDNTIGTGDRFVLSTPTAGGWVAIAPGAAAGGGISNAGESASGPSLALGPFGSADPVLAWTQIHNGRTDIFVLSWDGSAWNPIDGSTGPNGATPGTGFGASVALDSADLPMFSYQVDTSGRTETLVRSLDSAGIWQDLGSATDEGIQADAIPDSAATLFNDGGSPIVAFIHGDLTTGHSVYLLTWDGAAWQELGGSASGDGLSGPGAVPISFDAPSMTIDDVSQISVAWNGPRLAQFGGTWQGLDGSENAGVIGATDEGRGVRVASYGSAPLVVWYEPASPPQDIFARLYQSGTGWVDVGPSSSAGSGISGTGAASTPVIAMGPWDRPVVAWSDASTGVAQIYVRAFDGYRWVEVGAGSASGGGISDTSTPSTRPTLVVDRAGVATVAWQESLAGGVSEIYARRFVATCPPDMAQFGDPAYCIDRYEASVWQNADCTGAQYGDGADDYPVPDNVESADCVGTCNGEPVVPSAATAYACSLAGVLPSHSMTWFQAKRFCEASGKVLCSNTQWGVACLGATSGGTTYPYGDVYDPSACNGADNNVGGRIPTGSMAGCEGGLTGLFDMSGNLEEWTLNCFTNCFAYGGSFVYAGGTELTCSSSIGPGALGRSNDGGFRCCRGLP